MKTDRKKKLTITVCQKSNRNNE